MTQVESDALTKCMSCNGDFGRGCSERSTRDSATGVRTITRKVCLTCDKIERFQEYKLDGYISTGLMLSASLAGYSLRNGHQLREYEIPFVSEIRTLDAFSEWLASQAREFDLRLWSPEWRRAIHDSTASGFSGSVGGVKLMSFCCAGRCLLTFSGKGCSLTFITEDGAEGTGNMGWQGIGGTEPQIRELLGLAMATGARVEMSPDGDVRIAGF